RVPFPLSTRLTPASPYSFPTRRSSDLLDLTGRLCRGPGSEFRVTIAYIDTDRIEIVLSASLGVRDLADPDLAVLHRTLHAVVALDRKSTRLNSSHVAISYAVFCLNKTK